MRCWGTIDINPLLNLSTSPISDSDRSAGYMYSPRLRNIARKVSHILEGHTHVPRPSVHLLLLLIQCRVERSLSQESQGTIRGHPGQQSVTINILTKYQRELCADGAVIGSWGESRRTRKQMKGQTRENQESKPTINHHNSSKRAQILQHPNGLSE